MIYSTDQHGISLTTLYRDCESSPGPLLIVIKDEFDELFGAFASETLHVQTGFYGDGSCFLWKKRESSTEEECQIDVYKATGENNYLIYSEAHCIAFGGGSGRFGLWFDEELDHGHSEPSTAFRNERLSSEPDFHIQSIEIWGFHI